MTPTDVTTMTTYKRADGALIDDHSWVTDLEYFEQEDTPLKLIEEVWVLRSTQTTWVFPGLFGCGVRSCDEDATAWVWEGNGYAAACPAHTVESDWLDEQDALARVEDEARG